MILAAALSAAVALAIPPGVYSDYRIHAETGDELGMELDLAPDPKPTILFTLCEGACGLIVRLPVVPDADGRGFTFRYDEFTTLPGDKPGPSMVIRFAARYKGGRLIVRQIEGYDNAPETLRHIAARRALVSRYSR